MALTAPQRDEFLATPRVVALATNSDSGIPISVPVWFEWDGEVARMFTHKRSPKMKRLARDPRASLLVANAFGEPEQWVLLEGEIETVNEGAMALAETLAERYWDLSNPEHAKTLDSWRESADDWCLLILKPSKISSNI